MFAYPDAARYRLGANYQQLPTNAAKSPVYCPFQRDGKMNFSDNYGADANYVGSSLQPTKFYPQLKRMAPSTISTLTEHEKWTGEVCTFTSQVTDEDFVQPAALWEVIKREPGHEQRFYGNVAAHLSGVTCDRLRNDIYGRDPFIMLHPKVYLNEADNPKHGLLGSVPIWALVSNKPLRSSLLPRPIDGSKLLLEQAQE